MKAILKTIAKWASIIGSLAVIVWLVVRNFAAVPWMKRRIKQTTLDAETDYDTQNRKEIREIKKLQRERQREITRKIQAAKAKEIKRQFHEAFGQ